ncbi:MAG: class I SAM-dependent methyltransferase [Limnothrix sp.]
MKRFNYYDHIAKIYDQTRWFDGVLAVEIADFLLALVQATPATTFLEPGIGTGLNVLPLVKQGYAVTGMDISAAMLQQCCRKLGDRPANLTLIQGDASTLPLPDQSFDVVLTVHLTHAVSNVATFADEIHRVLRPGGFLLNAQWLVPPARLEFENHFRVIAAKHGQPITLFSQPKRLETDVELEQYLLKKGYRKKHHLVKEWTVENTVEELLHNFQLRAYGFCWRIEDAAFEQIMENFTTFCLEHYNSLSAELSSPAKYELWSYRKPEFKDS